MAVRRGAIHLLETGWAGRELGAQVFAMIAPEMPLLIKEYYTLNADRIPFIIAEHGRTSLDQYVRSEAVRNLFTGPELDTLLFITDSINITGLMRDIRNGKGAATSALMYHLYGRNAVHAPFFDSCMRAGLFRGEVSPNLYAGWYDRQLAYVNNLPQRYGAYTVYRFSDPETPIMPKGINNIDSVDIYRKEIGLPPLWQDCERIQIALPEGYR
jgi:hypothetical protein